MLNEEHSKQRKALRKIHAKQLQTLREHQRSERAPDYDIEDSLTLCEMIENLKNEVSRNRKWLKRIGHFGGTNG